MNTSTGSLDAQVQGPPARLPPESLRGLSPEAIAQAERRMVRKLDTRLIFPLIVIYIMNYLDRNAIAAAKVAGIEEDLGLTDSEYQTSVSILFVGYILMQVPSNLFLNKIGRPSIYLPACMAAWGVVCGATGAVHNFGGLVACRFVLGFVEAAYFPGCMSCLTAWYTRKELAFRTALLYCGSLLSGAFSGLIAAGITADLDGKLGIAAWRWLFIIEGAITVVIALGAFFVLPDFPANTRWIQGQEKDLAQWRLVEDVGEDDWTSSENESFFLGFTQCVNDYKTWFLVVLIFGAVSSGTINSYFPTVVATLNYSRTKTLLLTAPPYLLSCIVALLVSLSADRTGERYYHFTVPLWTSIAGFIISASTTNLGARYFSMMIMLPGVYTAFTIGLTWAANTLPRPPAKRAAAMALCNCISNCASIYGPFLYPQWTAPRYLIAMGVNAGTSLMSIVVATVFRFILIRLNRKLDVVEGREMDQDGERDEGPVLASKKFRYLY
ncbi:MFS general substrate transporter [Periconia macrospinosa]|uniref:MFS general substrate transporter n=1 Tax=Periconia macrospinosa TaxID=97972 RepID=A0A2V1DLZ6_9PLEO|nr:MFS general substrate transporter [Periconia macrospinosa]